MSATNREVLEVFVESVDELRASSYVKQAMSGGLGSSISFLKGFPKPVMGRSAPDLDSVKAALLTIRFFCQDNERTSLKNMNELIQGLPIEPGLKERFARSRDELHVHFDSKPVIGYPPNVGADTNWKIFDTFLYGQFAHSQPAKRQTVKTWQNEPYFNNLRSQFDLTLLHFISCVSVQRNVVAEILASGTF